MVTISGRNEELKPCNLVYILNNFKPRFKSCIFNCIFSLNGSFLGGDDWGFLKEVVETNLMTAMRRYFSVFTSKLHGKTTGPFIRRMESKPI
jgi:hypothetical protein